MEPYSYFLPKARLTNSLDQLPTPDERSIRTLEPVFTYTFNDTDTNDFHSICECKEPLCVTKNGKNILFAMRKWDKSILYKSYEFKDDACVLSKMRTLLLEKDYEHRLYDYNQEICFLFRSELVVSRGEGFTNIHVSCMVSDESGTWSFLEDVLTLEYTHFFNKYHVFLCAEMKKLVIVTGHYKYGFKKSHNELCDTHFQVLTYAVQHDASVQIKELLRRNVTEVCQEHRPYFGNYIDRVFFSIDGSKLFLISSKEYFVIVYSITHDSFGTLYLWDGSLRDPDWYTYFYAYHKDLGNVLYICEMNGHVTVLNELNLNMRELEDKSFAMCDLGFPFERFDFFVVDYFTSVVMYVLTRMSSLLLVVDCFEKKVIGKYLPPTGYHILDVTTNWSGEEVFLFVNTTSGGFELKVLYVDKKQTLKEIAKLAVLQLFSVKELKNMNLPRMLKKEINERFNQ